MRVTFALLSALALCAVLPSGALAKPARQQPAVGRIRETTVLNGAWDLRSGPADLADREKWISDVPPGASQAAVPALWSVPGRRPGDDVWAWRRFDFTPPPAGKAARILFGAVTGTAVVYLNGQQVAHHFGSYTPFEADITKAVRASGNVLAVRITPERGQDPGIWQSVQAVTHDEAYIEALWGELRTRRSLVTSMSLVNKSDKTGDAVIQLRLEDAATGAEARSATQLIQVTPGRNVASLMGIPKDPHYWSPEDPFLYRAQAVLYQDPPKGARDYLDAIETTVGMRTLGWAEGAPTCGGAPIKLSAISLTMNRPIVLADVADARKVQENFRRVRAGGGSIVWLAAPPPRVLDLADEAGIFVVETASGPDPDNAQLRELIRRDTGHPCVLGWGLSGADDSPATRALDPSRFLLREAGGARQALPPGMAAWQTAPAGLWPR